MARITVGTFNVENLFLRYKLLDHQRGDRSGKSLTYEDFKRRGNILMFGVSIRNYGPLSKSARKLTAKVILENDPDVLALQEVENLEALKQFNRAYLRNAYPYALAIDANDPRQIDVGLLSKFDIVAARTHQFEPKGSPVTQRIFSRDCLEVDVAVAKGKPPLTLFINHFKSQIGGGAPKRERQAKRVREILVDRFGSKLEGQFIVCGDLNAHYDAAELQALLGLRGIENAVATRLPAVEHWTHYYKRTKEASQYDYLLLSPELAAANPKATPVIDRKGLGTDITYYDGPRYKPKLTGVQGASDHCPVFMKLEV